MDVGLPERQISNSEVGQMNIGAGRILYQYLPRISKSIEDVYIHCFLDGRDVLQTSGRNYIKNLVEKIRSIGIGHIATIMGRFYSMVFGQGSKYESAVVAVENSYNNITDEFVIPTVITKDNKPIATISKNDSIIFYNFCADRARQITRSFVDPYFKGFHRINGYFPVHFICMTQYDLNMPNVSIAFLPEQINNSLGQFLSKKGLKQFRIAETQKYAHVTFFFNGGIEEPYKGEERLLVPSAKIKTFDEKPEINAYKVTEEVIKRIYSKKYDFILINYTNCDMVGYTGIFEATVKAVEVVDDCVGKVVKAVQQQGIVIITTDHGNCEQMIDYNTNEIYTPYTTNVVPFILIGKDANLRKGRLASIAPTVLDSMNIDKPKEMTEKSLIIK